ncbi:uncharacterized protein LOC105388799 isoform X2 [Plutella xylostella]|uniref:uncharacterized protein LOC105388799 isoform X2 n=1 Tax=Plutella xylostella TaxID=51655 RepID=UPI0020321D39|nr:uncharacterized protein LOC105388799 isoform X2 [Plutella xylostella]
MMSVASNNNKENFRLLDLSSDEESEDLQLEIIPRKKKISRRDRSRGPTRVPPEPSFRTEVQTAIRWAVRATLLLWLFSLTWTCAALYEQVSTMRMDIVKVSTSSDGVGDALQLCHTAAKELRANASELSVRLARLELEHSELAKRVEQASSELSQVSEQLSAAPKLADTPRRLAELQRNVADFGSQINGFDSALKSAHKLALTATSGVDEVRTSLHDLEARTNETIANVTATAKRTGELEVQIGAVNATVNARVQEFQTRLEAATRTTSTVAPTAAPSTTQVTSGAPTTSSTTTAAPPPGPPVKPNILQ